MGVGVVSGSIGARDRVPWIEKGIGAIATQGYTETMYGREGLQLLQKGLKPSSVLEKLLEKDFQPEKRQVIIMGASGLNAVHTGLSCPPVKHSEQNKNCIAAGNMLKNKETIQKMIETFESEEQLSKRIFKSLKAGAEAGGDKRGNRTAALIVLGSENIDIDIKSSEKPLQKLEKKLIRE